MCGLVGFISFSKAVNLLIPKKRFMYDGLYMNALRGLDSTGIALIKQADKMPIVYKKALPSFDFLQLKYPEKLLSQVDMGIGCLGHTRSSTRGSVIDDHAHPFQHGPITLIHNGTIHNFRAITREMNFNSEVDSEHICYALAHAEPKEVLEKVDGEFCFVWHDADKKTFNIAKNQGRPLTWAFIDEWEGMAFASEMGMLATILKRHDIEASPLNAKDEKKSFRMWYPDQNVLYQWDLEKKNIKEYNAIPFVPRPYPHTRATGRNHEDGTSTAQTGLMTEPVGIYTKIFHARENLTKQRAKYRPTGPKKLRKQATRLKHMGIDINTPYGVELKGWMPYSADKDHGVVWGITRAAFKGKYLNVIIHECARTIWHDIKDLPARIVAVGIYAIKDAGSFVVGELGTDYDDLVTELPFDVVEDIFDHDEGMNTLIEGPEGRWLPEDDWEELTEAGCSICSGHCNPDNASEMGWINNQPICHICAGDKDLQIAVLGGILNADRYKTH